MNYKIFNIPIPDSEQMIKQMNSFIDSVKLISLQKELVTLDKCCFWSFVVEYYNESKSYIDNRKSKVDYREILSAEDFAIYSQLRDLRKKIAEEEGIPVYAIFTNEQLASMVTTSTKTKTSMLNIAGIGEKKMSSYGDKFLKVLNP